MSAHVLLIDDEVDFLEGLSERMKLRGMNVECSNSGTDALKRVTDDSFDAIILDLQMPGMDGLEVLKQIREKNDETQVILLTGHATVEKSISAMKLGAMDFMEKPANLDMLIEKIGKAHSKKMVLVERRVEGHVRDIVSHKGW
ncbi:MAG: response regulator [Desulfovibrio sp.]